MTSPVTGKMKVRNVKFNFEGIDDQHYIASNIFATHFTNALHVIFPEGEKLFITSVKNFYDEIDDPILKKEMRDFMGQEGIHHREHERFWEKLESMGLKPRGFANVFVRLTKSIEWAHKTFLPERTAKKMLLTMTAGMEHYTALFGNQNLGNSEFLKPFYPKEMYMMIQWHSAEELEHKAVAFDVLQSIDDSYILRIWGMLFASILFYTFSISGMLYFIYQDKDRRLSGIGKQLKAFFTNFFFRPKGAEGWKLLLDYFKPGFHPDDHDNYHLAENFFKEYKDYFEKTEK